MWDFPIDNPPCVRRQQFRCEITQVIKCVRNEKGIIYYLSSSPHGAWGSGVVDCLTQLICIWIFICVP